MSFGSTKQCSIIRRLCAVAKSISGHMVPQQGYDHGCCSDAERCYFEDLMSWPSTPAVRHTDTAMYGPRRRTTYSSLMDVHFLHFSHQYCIGIERKSKSGFQKSPCCLALLPLSTIRVHLYWCRSQHALALQRTVAGCFAILRQLRSIRRSVPSSVFQTLVVALVLSRLDYTVMLRWLAYRPICLIVSSLCSTLLLGR